MAPRPVPGKPRLRAAATRFFALLWVLGPLRAIKSARLRSQAAQFRSLQGRIPPLFWRWGPTSGRAEAWTQAKAALFLPRCGALGELALPSSNCPTTANPNQVPWRAELRESPTSSTEQAGESRQPFANTAGRVCLLLPLTVTGAVRQSTIQIVNCGLTLDPLMVLKIDPGAVPDPNLVPVTKESIPVIPAEHTCHEARKKNLLISRR
jgi:hypothetical protein